MYRVEFKQNQRPLRSTELMSSGCHQLLAIHFFALGHCSCIICCRIHNFPIILIVPRYTDVFVAPWTTRKHCRIHRCQLYRCTHQQAWRPRASPPCHCREQTVMDGEHLILLWLKRHSDKSIQSCPYQPRRFKSVWPRSDLVFTPVNSVIPAIFQHPLFLFF